MHNKIDTLTDYITLSISTTNSKSKPEKFNDITYLQKTITISDYYRYIMNGYCFCHLFKFPAWQSFGTAQKSIANFKSTRLIFIDCDEVPYTLDVAFDKLSCKPNLSYTTFSNRLEGKGNRFRFIYFLDFDITSNDEYRYYLNIILNNIYYELGSEFYHKIDSHGFNVALQMMGSNEKATFKTNNENYYSKDIFTQMVQNRTLLNLIDKNDKEGCISLYKTSNYNKKEKGTITENIQIDTLIEETLKLYQNFQPKLDNIENVTYNDSYVYTDVGSQNIYQVKLLCNDKGERIRIKEGSRNKSLYYNGLKFRMINPNITIEELAASLYWYYNNACEVTDDMGILEICKIAIGCYKSDIKAIDKRQYVINPGKKNLSKIEKCKELGKARRRRRDNRILPNFDFSKSIKDNATELGVSRASIYNSLKENGVTLKHKDKYVSFCTIYLEHKDCSIRALARLCQCSTNTIRNYILRFNMNEAAKKIAQKKTDFIFSKKIFHENFYKSVPCGRCSNLISI